MGLRWPVPSMRPRAPCFYPLIQGFSHTHTQRCGLFVIFWEFEPESYRGRGEKRRLQFETPFAILFSPVLWLWLLFVSNLQKPLSRQETPNNVLSRIKGIFGGLKSQGRTSSDWGLRAWYRAESRSCCFPASALRPRKLCCGSGQHARALRDAAAKTAACRDAADIASAAAKMRSSCLRQAGAHSVPDWGLVRWTVIANGYQFRQEAGNSWVPYCSNSLAKTMPPQVCFMRALQPPRACLRSAAAEFSGVCCQAFGHSQKGFGEHLLSLIRNTSVRWRWQDLRNRSWCKICTQVAWQDLCARSMQGSFVKISVKDRPQVLLDRFCVKAAGEDPCARQAVQGVYKRPPQKTSVSDLKVKSLLKLSRQHLWARSLLSSPGLCTRSLLVVSCPDLCTRSIWILLARFSVGSLLTRSPNKI